MVLLFTFMILYDIILIVNTAQLKTIIDRFYSIFNNPNKKFSGKVALIFTHAILVMISTGFTSIWS